MAARETELRAYWQRAVAADTGPFERLVARYREPHRRYHTVAHLGWVLRHVDELASEARPADVGAVMAAAFFHDVVYEPMSSTNEADSATLARRELGVLGGEAEPIAAVASMIEGTAHHVDPPDDDTAVLFDADLAVLGATPAAYGDYVRAVRAEYQHVDDDAWRAGRAAVLRSFLERASIYATDGGRRRWEATARGNLTAELATLT